jgi:hypothetical protein
VCLYVLYVHTDTVGRFLHYSLPHTAYTHWKHIYAKPITASENSIPRDCSLERSLALRKILENSDQKWVWANFGWLSLNSSQRSEAWLQ